MGIVVSSSFSCGSSDQKIADRAGINPTESWGWDRVVVVSVTLARHSLIQQQLKGGVGGRAAAASVVYFKSTPDNSSSVWREWPPVNTSNAHLWMKNDEKGIGDGAHT